MEIKTKSGYVSITGQPNVGKSTILNGLLKEKLAIISKKPETTRDNLVGILTEGDTQIIFIDTPGIHKPHDLLGKMMLKHAASSMMEADVILFVTEKRTAFNKNDENIIERLPDPAEGKKVIFVINKVDIVKDKRSLLPIMEKAGKLYPFNEIIPISAIKKDSLGKLLELIKSYLPEGPFYYPEDQLTDKDDRFLAREIIREKILEKMYEEVPHSVAVVIDEMKEDKKKVSIQATIFVERTSQKSIIIGKAGANLKKIGTDARRDIERLTGKRVRLDLWVKVYEKWKQNPAGLKEMGYGD